ncbi:pimeloyl-[acyl-carrier protein] methyl ester esterase [Vibrio aquaticus]|uniref:Pimeloyl-[acyl-carrier protein] methyl ester esterase n=1 Tax=Vibrio aquaticus TaxID=2496559 RepID=A0A432CWG9_9VIBR|nr:pimeloyl-ACP methyl ester esterase BioH [Vibrio aquaticus]RTZ14604.1 pimeloyl-[acyl-carrier protein] methyl ester esterase [Vibrio aquaticus]
MNKVVQSEIKTEPLHWQTTGSGQNIVLVHGWGMNGAVWQQTVDDLSQHYCVHVVDLPGFGHSHQTSFSNMSELANQVLQQAPKSAIWLGWSLGGLVATHIALNFPERVTKLITVASSPKFSADRPWRGIQPAVLSNFTEQLVEDFQLTIERFMALQAMGSPSARQDVKQLKKAVLSRPTPNPTSLLAGLNLLADIDYRAELEQLTMPMLRLYGRLDGLVPVKVASDVDKLHPDSESFTFTASSHAPFMTEFDGFCEKVRQFTS